MNWQSRAERVILDGCSTFSKRVQSYVKGVYCSHVKSGDGKYLVMADGSRKFDTVSGLGSNLRTCKNNYSMECIESVTLAEKLLEYMPYHSKLKFLKTGSAACEAAVRYARDYTHRQHIAFTGYHGCSHIFVSCTPPALGTVYEMCQKFESIEDLTDYVEARPGLAGCIVEALELSLDNSLVTRLERLQEACRADGCVLIFDEIITGWRVPGFTVANYLDIYPDISVLGKALGDGDALAVVAVTSEIAAATEGVFVSNTHNGSQEALRGALELINSVTSDDIAHMWELSQTFQYSVNKIQPHTIKLTGYPARYVWECRDELVKAKTWQECYDRGLFVGAAFFPKITWDQTDYDMIYKIIREAILSGAKLRGKPPAPVFKRV